MKKRHYLFIINMISFALLLNLAITSSSSAQADSVKIINTNFADSVKKTTSPAQIFTAITKDLVNGQKVISLQVNEKISCRIRMEDTAYQVPGGESRVALFELPPYLSDYMLTIKSKNHGIGFSMHLFAPTAVFLDSSMRPIRFIGERNFLVIDPESFKAIHLKTEFTIDKERENYRYLLIYTSNTKGRIGTYQSKESADLLSSLLKHPVERTPDGRLQIELHLR